MRPLVVVEELVVGEAWNDAGDGQGAVVEAPELDPRGAVGALHAAVVLRPARRGPPLPYDVSICLDSHYPAN